MEIFVTVGMGRWPFDRLLHAVEPLCRPHTVFVQTGTSKVALPCASSPYLTFPETLARIEAADIVIAHAGNTLRLVQRQGKVPIAMAREAARDEMANDHQVTYLRFEEAEGRAVPIWNPADLPRLVETHLETQARLLATCPLPSAACGERLAATLDSLCDKWIRAR